MSSISASVPRPALRVSIRWDTVVLPVAATALALSHRGLGLADRQSADPQRCRALLQPGPPGRPARPVRLRQHDQDVRLPVLPRALDPDRRARSRDGAHGRVRRPVDAVHRRRLDRGAAARPGARDAGPDALDLRGDGRLPVHPDPQHPDADGRPGDGAGVPGGRAHGAGRRPRRATDRPAGRCSWACWRCSSPASRSSSAPRTWRWSRCCCWPGSTAPPDSATCRGGPGRSCWRCSRSRSCPRWPSTITPTARRAPG